MIQRKSVNIYHETSPLVFCHTERINFEAKTNFDVGNVKFSITREDDTAAGPSSYTSQDYEAPYFLFPGDVPLISNVLKPAWYILTAVAANKPNESKKVPFVVKICQ